VSAVLFQPGNPLEGLNPRLVGFAPEPLHGLDVGGAEVAVQVGTAVGAFYFVPLDGGRVEVGEAQLEDPDLVDCGEEEV
jgi:hypothetical protein